MAKTKISEYDATAANNTDIDSISIAEGMAPSNVNNSIRAILSHLKKMDVGTDALTSPQLTSVDINGGTIDGAVIGANSAAAITGTTITGTSLVIGSANINENDFESIDGITAGTVAASKAVIVDTNKDITGFRNVTLTGELDAATLDVSGDIDVDGTANLDVVDIDGAVDMASTLTLAGNADFNGDLDVDGTANLDVVDIDGAVDMASTLAVATSLSVPIFYTGVGSQGVLNTNTNDLVIKSQSNDNHIYMANNGAVTLYHDNAAKLATASGGITVTGNIANASGDLTLDVAGNIKLDADDNGEVRYLDGGTQYLYIKKDGNTAVLQNVITDGDIHFIGDNGGSPVTALKLDMSEGGAATFAGNMISAGTATFGTSNASTHGVDKVLNAISSGSANQQLGLYDTLADSSTRYSAVFHRVGTNGSMTWVGSISNNSSSVAFNTSSDYRLKENVSYTWDATTRL